MSVCGSAPAGYVADKTDCCDEDPDAFPGQAKGFSVEVGCSGGGYDYNCNGTEELGFPSLAGGTCCATCTYVNGWYGTVIPACGDYGTLVVCNEATSQPEQFPVTDQICR